MAPKLIYEEGDLIKRAMRDLYTRDIEEVLVEGDEGYRSAKRLMSMLMPSRARLVKQYREETPLFFAYKVEDQLDAMHSPTVQLPSGGSIVIHTTEALTAIDVNSRPLDARAPHRRDRGQDQPRGRRRGGAPAAPARSRRA